jgi:hypothetical protein
MKTKENIKQIITKAVLDLNLPNHSDGLYRQNEVEKIVEFVIEMTKKGEDEAIHRPMLGYGKVKNE